MKPFLLLLAMVGFTLNVFANETDTCETYTKQSIKQYYENCLAEVKYGNPGTTYVHHFFKVPDKEKMKTVVEWVEKKGYGTKSSEGMILFEKPFENPEFEAFFSEQMAIWEMRQRLDIATCYGSGRGVGASSFLLDN